MPLQGLELADLANCDGAVPTAPLARIDARRDGDVMEISAANNFPHEVLLRWMRVRFRFGNDAMRLIMHANTQTGLAAMRTFEGEPNPRAALMEDVPARVKLSQLHGRR